MARTAHPWFWEERNGWYVNKDGRRHFLGEHPNSAPDPKKVKGKWNAPEPIRVKFHAVMAEVAPAAKTISATGLTLAELFEKYLDWCQKHRSPRTYDGYQWHIQAFCDHLKTAKTLPALSLKPFHIIEWLDAHASWGATYRRNATGSIQRAFNWAEELGYLDANPVRKIKKPMATRREKFITPEEWVQIRDSYKPADPFREFLEFCWETGARPFEARNIEGRHVNLERAVIAIPPEEAKGKKKWRIIRLEGKALELVRKRAKAGRLFLNEDGNPWTTFSISCRFKRIAKKIGVKHFAYGLRHGFCQRMLEAGVDLLTVAALLGHADGQMVSRVYSHMSQADDHLREALKKNASA